MQLALFAVLLCLGIAGVVLLRRTSQRDTPEATRALLAQRAVWTQQNRIPIGLVLAGGLFGLTGGALGVHAMLGETHDVQLARLEAGEPSDATFMRVHGFARGEFAVCRETRRHRTCRTPLTSTPNGTETAVLLSSTDTLHGERDVAGMVYTDDLWGLDELREAGLTPTRTAFVLLSGETPEARRPLGLVIFLVGAVMSVVGALWLRRNPMPR